MQNSMKRTILLCLAVTLVQAGTGCGRSQQEQGNKGSAYASALEVLETVAGAYTAEDQFAMYGGDQEHAVMDAPGSFDIRKTEELEAALGLPAALADGLEDAASMVHMMNSNTFTGAAYRLKDHTDKTAFVQEATSALLKKQWMCGQPDTLAVLDVDGSYLIIAYGEAEIMKTFQAHALSALPSAKVLTEAPVA